MSGPLRLPGIGGSIVPTPGTEEEIAERAKSGQFYKYMSYVSYIDTPRYISNTISRGRMNTDISNLIKLGGAFEKVGEDDEDVGGNNQEMG